MTNFEQPALPQDHIDRLLEARLAFEDAAVEDLPTALKGWRGFEDEFKRQFGYDASRFELLFGTVDQVILTMHADLGDE